MGCCLSTKKAIPLGPPNDQNALTNLHLSRDRAPPPPASIEEETVKEVLSVSKTPKPVIVSPKPKISSGTGETKPPVVSHAGSVDLKDPDLVEDAVSEPARSELSSSTVTNDFSYEEEREVRSRGRRARSSPGGNSRVSARPEWNSGAARDRVVGRSPTRRSDLSPARRGAGGGMVRVAPGREQHQSGPGTGPGQVAARRGLRYDPNRKDPAAAGDGRRSRSPAANRSTTPVGRNPSSIRRFSQSPGRVRADPGGEGLKKAEESGGGGGGSKWPSYNPNSSTPEEAEEIINPNESLENPLVSLECFIFL